MTSNIDNVVCPACGAANTADARRCWMCGREAWRAPAGAGGASKAQSTERPWMATPRSTDSIANHFGAILIAVVILAVFLGLFPFAPGIAVAVAAIGGLSLALIFLHRNRQIAPRPMTDTRPGTASASKAGAPPPQSYERRVSTASIVLGVLGSVLAVFGVVAVTALFAMLSALIAFFRMCGLL